MACEQAAAERCDVGAAQAGGAHTEPGTCGGAASKAPAATAPQLTAELARLKRERDAVVLAHYYTAPEVQAASDYVGDSFYLAKLAVTLPQHTVVLAGVSFMGESVKLLNPAKTVLLPDSRADCPMAHMVNKATVDDARARYGDDLAVVCYVNSTIEIKSWSDVCVTSSNAVKIVRELPQHHILFIPDRNLGRYVAAQVPAKHVILNDGCCPRHVAISLTELRELKAANPAAPVLAHPECTEEVLAEADYIGSTSGIIEYAAASDARTFIIATVHGVSYELERRCAGQGKRFLFPATLPSCADMDRVTLEKVVACLRAGAGSSAEVAMPPAVFAEPAKRALDRMLELAAR